MSQLRNRIIGEGEEAPDQLLANPRNWRIHPLGQQDALTQLLEKVGWVQRIIVNQRTGYVLDGHLRVSLAISRNEQMVPVQYVDLSDEEERLVLSTFDPITSMIVPDRSQLRSLVEEQEATDGAIGELLATLHEEYKLDIDDDEALGLNQDIPESCICPTCGTKHKTPTN